MAKATPAGEAPPVSGMNPPLSSYNKYIFLTELLPVSPVGLEVFVFGSEPRPKITSQKISLGLKRLQERIQFCMGCILLRRILMKAG
jgi:hypothetical protein